MAFAVALTATAGVTPLGVAAAAAAPDRVPAPLDGAPRETPAATGSWFVTGDGGVLPFGVGRFHGLPVGIVPFGDARWDLLAQCESRGRWNLDTGTGYYGGVQLSLSSWRAVGGSGYPHHHSRETQIEMAERLLSRQGWDAWPHCARKVGFP